MSRGAARRWLRLAAVAVAGLVAGCAQRAAPAGPAAVADRADAGPTPAAFGGVAYLAAAGDATQYLVVTDLKAAGDPRLGVVTLDAAGGLRDYATLAPPHWRRADGAAPMDLESLCRLPGAPLRFLTAESGQGRNGRGQLFELELAPVRAAGSGTSRVPRWRVAVIATYVLPPADVPNSLNYEGLLCAPGVGRDVRLLLADRAGRSLRTGLLRASSGRLEWSEGEAVSMTWSDPPEWAGEPLPVRRVADLALAPDGVVWGVAGVDPGDDGPFHSWLYRLGPLVADVAAPASVAALRPAVAHRLDGDKVEGITFAPDGRVVYVSDNENLRSGAGRLEPAP